MLGVQAKGTIYDAYIKGICRSLDPSINVYLQKAHSKENEQKMGERENI